MGQMTDKRRRLSIKKEAMQSALREMDSISDSVFYPRGTMIVGEHLEHGSVVETTVMVKQFDAIWTFMAYDREGRLTKEVEKSPDPLSVPTKCLGCHFGDRQFEPERSYPSPSRPGPNGERALYVNPEYSNPIVKNDLLEHSRRSDSILGLYATLYVSEALIRAKKGEASNDEISILTQLGYDLQSQ